ncbi:MAG: sigma-54-dependent transcriptional regulator [Vicinamibacteraceae bacterium]
MPIEPKTLLIVDDDEGMRDTLTAILKRDYTVRTAASAEAGLEILRKVNVHLMLLDVRLPGMSGLDLLRIIREQYSMVEAIVISAISEVETAVQAMKLGAYHYITKEFEYDALRSLMRHASERLDLNRRVLTLTAQVAEQQDEREFVTGPSPTSRAVLELAAKVAGLSATVLVTGESGTGKELLARKVHRESAQRDGPFIPINLAAIPTELVESTLFGHERGAFTGAVRQQMGKFEMAAGGTLFLDEIGDLRVDLQAKLLRALQEGEIERVGGTKPIKTQFRLVVATNIDLERAVREGRFREDLYYRINVVPVRLPPLRERAEDVPVLVEVFLRRYAARFRKPITGISPGALEILKAYYWPGNIRELQNLIERLVATSDSSLLTEGDVPIELHLSQLGTRPGRSDSLLDDALSTFERSFLLKSLERCEWNITATARYLGIPLSTLKFKLGRLDVYQLARRLRES